MAFRKRIKYPYETIKKKRQYPDSKGNLNGADRRWELLKLTLRGITVNDPLSTLGAFLKTKAIRWTLVWTSRLFKE